MQRFQPDVVLGMGGYVSGPGGLAAWSLGIPVVLHEQNGIAGLTNKWLAKIAKKVMQAFPGAFPHADVVGNPVRTDVLALPLPEQRLVGRQGPIRVLVVGGSQGARVLNQTMPQVAAKLGSAVTIWHQSGKGGQRAYSRPIPTPASRSTKSPNLLTTWRRLMPGPMWSYVVPGR